MRLSGVPAPVPAGEARVAALDRGLLLGEAIYETLRTYRSRPFAVGRHLERLARGSEAWGFPPLDLMALSEAVRELASLRSPEESALRITVSRAGPHPWAAEEDLSEPSWGVFAGPLPPHLHPAYERGVRCILASRVRWNPGGFIPAVKFTANPDIQLARREARAAGAYEAILLNPAGLVAEGATSSVFLVKARRLVTPSLETGILDGVTRAIVLELARRRGLAVEEREVAAWELHEAEEVFLTSSLKEVVPVVNIGGVSVGTGSPGRITDHLLGAYQELCIEQSSGPRPEPTAGG